MRRLVISFPSIRVTLIAGRRVVAVAANLVMDVVRFDLVVTVQAVERARGACRVTECAGNVVVSLEWERVLERRRRPRSCVVTLLAVLREVHSHVIGTEQKVVGMTGKAIRWDRLKVTPGVATRAEQARVRAGEREEVVLEAPARPARGSVAALAIGCPAVRRVVGRLGACQTPLMAELALCRGPFELADSRLEVTALAGHHGVRGDQVKSRRGVLCDESGRPPVNLAVTALAIKPERRSVRVGVTSAAAPD